MTDRWKTRFTVSGRGPALVLIHGVGLDLTMWDATLPILEPHFTVIRYDLIGHGATPAAGSRVTLDEFVAQLADLV
ncbi:MAG: alpha/beta fold hydrolase, partial [Burkholderiales bacterium]